MRRRIKWWWLILLLAGTAMAQTPCEEQIFRHLDDLEDPNGVVVDPYSGRPLLAQYIRGKTNTDITIRGNICDPDGDAMILWRDDPGSQIPFDPNTGDWSITVNYAESGEYYVTVGVTDGAATVMGTYAVRASDNRAPVLAARPPDEATSVARNRQRLLMTWHRWTGLPLHSGFVFVKR